MKTSYDNSQLDNFLRDALKNLDIQYQQSDWSDMESLLGPAQKPIDFNISKKTILISASVIVITVIGIIISQTVHFYNSSPEEISPENTDSNQSLLKAVDTQKTIVATPNPVTPAIDTVKTELLSPVQQNKIVDSAKPGTSADTTSMQKINNNQKNSKNISQKTDKKKKQNTAENPSSADTASVKTPAELPAMDTLSKHPHQEITLPTPADSSKKNKKDKKQKLKFLFRQKQDSLKHP